MSQPIEQKYFPGDEIIIWCPDCEIQRPVRCLVKKLVWQGDWEQEGSDNMYRVELIDSCSCGFSFTLLDLNEECLETTAVQYMKNIKKNRG